MQRNGRRVVVLGTGGTIAGLAASSEDHLGYASAQLGVAQIVAATTTGDGVAVETEQVAQLDSKDMDFATWLKLAGRIAHHSARPEVAGIVVTHGTDTLEETAYFLSRIVAVAKPVVLTGAMRPASSSEADGPRNLADAIAVAAHAEAAGVVAVLAGTVHSARDVRKLHPTRVDAFSSGDAGVLGHVAGGTLQQVRSWPTDEAIGIDRLPDDVSRWPRVEIVASTAGADARIVAALLASGVDGIVVAATGNGTVHHALEGALVEATRRGVSVLRSTRCADGRIVDPRPALLPSADDLVPAKARIELMLRLLIARG